MEEALRINRALHGDKDHPDVGATLHALGELSQKTGVLEKAEQ